MSYYWIFSKIYERAAKKMCLDCQDFIEKDSKILDLGCGSGIITKEFQNFFQAKTIGVDIKDNRVEKIPFKIIDGKSLLFPENYFDVVLINYVLHHSQDPAALLREAKRVTRDKILIYEDLPEGLLSKLICKIHGITFNKFFQNKKQRCNFKNTQGWKLLFKNLGLKLIFEKRISSILNLPKKRLFVLEKK